MNKAKLVEHMAKATKMPKSACKECLEAFIAAIGAALKGGKPVVLTGFGTFTTLKRKSRVGVNPATGKKMRYLPKNPKIQAGKALKAMVK